jgi:hypothetical protein
MDSSVVADLRLLQGQADVDKALLRSYVPQ